MSTKKKITVQGLEISIEKINNSEYVSLTDIAKRSKDESKYLVISWMKNAGTFDYLEAWEEAHNPQFKVDQMVNFRKTYSKNRNVLTPQKWIKEVGAIGIISKSGRGGGTFAHPEIALDFCRWLEPAFAVWMNKEFLRLKNEEAKSKNLEWHIERITNLVEETRNWLDTIPYQNPERNRLNYLNEDEK